MKLALLLASISMLVFGSFGLGMYYVKKDTPSTIHLIISANDRQISISRAIPNDPWPQHIITKNIPRDAMAIRFELPIEVAHEEIK